MEDLMVVEMVLLAVEVLMKLVIQRAAVDMKGMVAAFTEGVTPMRKRG